MAKQDVNYSALTNEGNNPFVDLENSRNPFGGNSEDDHTHNIVDEETPRNSGVMIHVVPETNKARWNHIEDLDSFFTRMYCYHQKHGFYVITLQEIFELLQFIFVVAFTTYLFHCVNYPVLFGDKTTTNRTKVTLDDAIYPTAECVASLGGVTWCALMLAALFWIFRLIRVVYHIFQFWDIKKFFNTALKIEDEELDNLTWHEIQKKIREVQSEQQMCIHKEQLTELDIYHRILRFKNYMVAMMNKNLLPARFMIPYLGEYVGLSRSLRYNIELILFRGPWSPFENNWHLREEFKRSNKRNELAEKLSRQILWVAIANLMLSPLIFLWQLMYFFFNYGELIKREPGTLGMRCWSQYGRLYLRHFNELEHELDARLNRAYRPAVRYMNSFSSPLMAVIAKNVVFICGGILIVLILLTVYDEDVVQVEHVLTIMSVLTAIVVVFRVFIPDDNMIWCPEQLLTAVLAHVHYLPGTWRGLAHTSRVRQQFGHFFQFRAVYLINELMSPLTTPFVLWHTFRPRALEVVDFFRHFTVSVVGVGDVCSFAQMDVRKHGNPDWQPTRSYDEMQSTNDEPKISPTTIETNQYTQGEHGKTELSLVHFTLTNPEWRMPSDAKNFVHGIKRHAIQDLNKVNSPAVATVTAIANPTAMGQSLMSFGSLGGDYSSIAHSIFQAHNMPSTQAAGPSYFQTQQQANPFSPQSATGPAAGGSGPSNVQSPSTAHAYDFEHMLQQNLYDGSTMPMRSGFLQNIQERDDEESRSQRRHASTTAAAAAALRSATTGIMDTSMRGALSRTEGRIQGPSESLVYSLHGVTPALEIDPSHVTAADMCLSTLYLHEIHHRQIQRRGGGGLGRGGSRYEQSARQMWQRPHQQQEQPTPLQTTSADRITLTPAAERTPLLSQKKS